MEAAARLPARAERLRAEGLSVLDVEERLADRSFRLRHLLAETRRARLFIEMESGAASLDCLYSSHCLEHLPDPVAALERWAEAVRPGGFLYLVVPDFDLYEGGEGIRNRFHKTAFSLRRPTDPSIPLINVADLFAGPLRGSLRLWYLGLCDDHYDHAVGASVDQTRLGAVCHIEIMVQRTGVPLRRGGR